MRSLTVVELDSEFPVRPGVGEMETGTALKITGYCFTSNGISQGVTISLNKALRIQ